MTASTQLHALTWLHGLIRRPADGLTVIGPHDRGPHQRQSTFDDVGAVRDADARLGTLIHAWSLPGSREGSGGEKQLATNGASDILSLVPLI
jgi:hypothetical protein